MGVLQYQRSTFRGARVLSEIHARPRRRHQAGSSRRLASRWKLRSLARSLRVESVAQSYAAEIDMPRQHINPNRDQGQTRHATQTQNGEAGTLAIKRRASAAALKFRQRLVAFITRLKTLNRGRTKGRPKD